MVQGSSRCNVMHVTSNLFEYQQSDRSEGAVGLDDRAHVSATWQCGAFGQLRLRGALLGLLVYAASEGGARELATWVIMVSSAQLPSLSGPSFNTFWVADEKPKVV
jgi:hypothetical protein